MNEQAEKFFLHAKRWQDEYLALRKIILDEKELVEDFKWKHPCYTYQGKNVLLIHGFKHFCALLFYKGVLLNDSHGMLVQQTENVQSVKQIRFTSLEEIIHKKPIIQDYIRQALAIEKSGKKVMIKPVSAYPTPIEFQKALEENESLHTAFYSLTPGRQKGYLLYFNQAKQAKTREARIEKYYQQILDGKGLED